MLSSTPFSYLVCCLVVFAAAVNSTVIPANYKCNVNIDIVFQVDYSGRILKNFERIRTEKAFVKNMIKHFHIGENETRVGMGVFANVIDKQWCLSEYFTAADLDQRVTIMHCHTCRPRGNIVGEALTESIDFFRNKACGSRTAFPKLVVVLTTGRTTEGLRVFTSKADTLKNYPNTHVEAIGTGRYNENRLRTIASDEKLVFTDIDTNNMEYQAYLAARAACDAVQNLPVAACPVDWSFDVSTQRCYRWILTDIRGGDQAAYEAKCAEHHNSVPAVIENRDVLKLIKSISTSDTWLNIKRIAGHWWWQTNPKSIVEWNNFHWSETQPYDCMMQVKHWGDHWGTFGCGVKVLAGVICSMPRGGY